MLMLGVVGNGARIVRTCELGRGEESEEGKHIERC